MLKGKLLFLGLILFISVAAFAQNTIGIPKIVNYLKEDYNAGSQNWNIVQDRAGIIYFANNSGMLSFDGTFWRTYQLPNKTIVRSLTIGEDGKIYVGGQQEIGYFSPAENGELAYTSLNTFLPPGDNGFADVWNICIFQKHIFFRSNRKILEYDQQKQMIVHNSTNWSFMGMTANELFAYEFEKGLVAYKNGKWEPRIKVGKLPQDIQFRGAINIGKDSVFLPSLFHGIYILHGDTIAKFEPPGIAMVATKNIFGACLVAADRIALATNLAGCIIINKKGEIIQRFTKKEGIQNNNVQSVMLDKDKNLWLGLDNGIDLITYSNAIKNIFPDQEERSSGYTSMVYKNKLYLGISTGVYKMDIGALTGDLSYSNTSFDFVENTKGQVWSLSVVNDKLIAGHNKGAFLIENGIASSIDDKTGFWGFQPLYDTTTSPVVIAGTYNGINFYDYKNGKFFNPNIHAQFESARFVVRDKDIIWVAHPYKGLYKVTFKDSHHPVATVYDDKKNILSSNHNKIFRVLGRIVLTTDKGIFEYDPQSQDFIHSSFFEKIFNGIPISYIKSDSYGNIWFCRDKKLGIVDRSTGTPRILQITELDGKIMGGGFENINIVDSNNVFVAAEKGFFHINYVQYKKSKHPLHVLVRNVQSSTSAEGLIYGGYSIKKDGLETPSLSFKRNSLHFEFSSILYGQKQNTEYSYYLDGFDKGWSEWTKKTEKDYTNLPAGRYEFQVKCRNNTDNESPVTTYSFTILPPWYQSWWAYTLYLLIFASLLYLFYKRQQRKYKHLQKIKLQEQQRKYDEEQKQLQYLHQLEIEKNEKEIMHLKNENLQAEIEQGKLEEERKRLQYLHQIEVEKNEKEIIHLRNEKLQSEVLHKNSELASSAMNLVRKMEILSKLKEDLISYKDASEVDKASKEFQKIIRVIDKELDHTQEWEQFAKHFDSVHTNYLKKLKEYCPDLTATELKLAAYLRLSLSSKEIAQLMNISIRGVETSRYRLRKKLGLNNEVNLFDFLISITH